LIGGQLKESGTDKIYKLQSLDEYWTEYSEKLLLARRSHSVLKVPLSFCKGIIKMFAIVCCLSFACSVYLSQKGGSLILAIMVVRIDCKACILLVIV